MSFFDNNAFSYDTNSGYGGFSVDDEGAFNLPGLSGTGALSPGGMNKYVESSYDRNKSGDSFTKILEALDKANAFKAQSAAAGSSGATSTGNSGSFQKISDTASVYFPPPKQKITGGSSGGGLGSTIGSIAGTALGALVPGLQPFTPLLARGGQELGGLIG